MFTINSNSRLARIVIFSVVAMGSATVSNAADDDVRNELVKYGDINVSNPEGAAVLLARIQGAARHVCERFDANNLSTRAQFQACMTKAVAAAVDHVNRPTLTALYDAKSGKKSSAPILIAGMQGR